MIVDPRHLLKTLDPHKNKHGWTTCHFTQTSVMSQHLSQEDINQEYQFSAHRDPSIIPVYGSWFLFYTPCFLFVCVRVPDLLSKSNEVLLRGRIKMVLRKLVYHGVYVLFPWGSQPSWDSHNHNGLIHPSLREDHREAEGWAKERSESEVVQLCLTLCDPMDCSLPGSSVHGSFQARILEWVAISFSISSRPRDWTQVSCIVGRQLYYLSHQGNRRVGLARYQFTSSLWREVPFQVALKALAPLKSESSGLKVRVWFFFPGPQSEVMVFSCRTQIMPSSLQKAQLENGLAKSQGTVSAASGPKKKKKSTAKSLLVHIVENKNSRDNFRYGRILVFSIVKNISVIYFSTSEHMLVSQRHSVCQHLQISSYQLSNVYGNKVTLP